MDCHDVENLILVASVTLFASHRVAPLSIPEIRSFFSLGPFLFLVRMDAWRARFAKARATLLEDFEEDELCISIALAGMEATIDEELSPPRRVVGGSRPRKRKNVDTAAQSWVSLAEEKWQTRVHLEVEMSAALALKSASEYRRCLTAYACCLTMESDEARLRELCEELLGPVHLGPCCQLSSAGDNQHPWESDILPGLSKRELLKDVVLPAMAANRAIQRLLNEFADLVTECEAAQKASEPGAGSIL